MKIALITARVDPFISPHDMNGGCVLVRNYIKALHKLGHDIHVFTRLDTYSKNNSDKTNIKAKMQADAGTGKVKVNKRLTIYRLPYEPFKNKTWKEQMEESASFLRNVKVYFDAEKFDIYHYFHLLSLAGWNLLTGEIPHLNKTTFSPLLLTIGREFEFPSKERIDFERDAIKKLPAISCQSVGEMETIRNEYGITDDKLVHIPLGVDTEIFYVKQDITHAGKENRTILISPNTIKHQKRQLEVIHIAHALKERGFSIITAFMGRIREPEYLEEMRSLISSSGMALREISEIPSRKDLLSLDTDFIYIPGKKEKVLAGFIRSGDVAIFPSTDEGFGLLNLDCMACGTLPVCTDLKAYGDYLVAGENAIVVDKKLGWEGFVKNIEDLINNKERMISLSKISANSVQQYSWDNLIRKQLFVYTTLHDKVQLKPAKYHEQNWINLND
ncbi:glycosyltransferase family 4 protein [Patescibacteria group bacterium]|nr:glycosyltransferase family 4 protein [Patescibacteria group bacterium]